MLFNLRPVATKLRESESLWKLFGDVRCVDLEVGLQTSADQKNSLLCVCVCFWSVCVCCVCCVSVCLFVHAFPLCLWCPCLSAVSVKDSEVAKHSFALK